MGFTPFVQAPTLALQAATVGPFTLVNGTPTIVSWTAPNDGAEHRAMVVVSEDITVAATGGAVGWTFTAPDGSAATPTLIAGGQATGAHHATDMAIVGPGTTVTIKQSGALTIGAGVVWAEIWGS